MGTSSIGHAINDEGPATGHRITTGNAASHALVRDNGPIQDPGALADTQSYGAAIDSPHATLSVFSLIGDKDGFGIGAQADESFNPNALPGYDGPGDADGTDKWFFNQQSFTFSYAQPASPVIGAQLEVFSGGQGFNVADPSSGAPTSVFLNDTFIGYLTIGDIGFVDNNIARKDVFDLGPFLGLLTGSDTVRFRPWSTGTALGDGWVLDYAELTLTVNTPSPGELLDALARAVEGVGPGKSLADKVALAQGYYAVQDLQATCAVLTGFLNEVRAQSGKKLTAELASQLTADAQVIVEAIGCN